jgi:hypothetical protein
MLSELNPGRGYTSNEIAFKDKWMHPYMGKIYSTVDTELMSMGLEFLYRDPVGLARQDPEFFDLLVRLIKGQI